MPIASDSEPNLVTIDLAVKSLTNRAIFIGIFFLIALATFLFGLRTLFVRLPRISKMLSMLNRAENKPWRLVALETNKDVNKYTTTLNGKSIEMSFNFTKNKPCLLTDINGNKHLLAIAAKNSDTAIPLDEQLMMLKGLKKKEREQLQQSLNAQVSIFGSDFADFVNRQSQEQ